MTRTERVTIAFSGLALIISAASWWDSHSALVINRANSRARLYLGPARVISTQPRQGNIQLTIHNSGNTSAADIKLSYKVGIISSGAPYFDPPAPAAAVPNMMPAETVSRELHFDLPYRPQPDDPADLACSVDVEYKDEATGQTFKEHQIFQILFDGTGVIAETMQRGTETPEDIISKWRAKHRKGEK
jgi:hypothetical protein